MSEDRRRYRIAVIPGDGIGMEIVPEGIRVLEAVAKRYGLNFIIDWFDFSSCHYYFKHKRMLPEGWQQLLSKYDAIYFGTVGWPAKVPDHISLSGSLLTIQRKFEQFINLRSVRLLPGISSRLAYCRPGDIDCHVICENPDISFSSLYGRTFGNSADEVVLQEAILGRVSVVDQILEYAFRVAQRRERKHLSSATRQKGFSISFPHWEDRVGTVGALFPEVKQEMYNNDALIANFVQDPSKFDIVVTPILLADMLVALGGACTGTSKLTPSASINPRGSYPSLFKPLHGSAPDIAGRGISNPVGQIWAVATMLEHFGESDSATAIISAIERVLSRPNGRTQDLNGRLTTIGCGKAIASEI